MEQLDRGEQRGSRGAIDRCIIPNLGRAKVHEVDAATLDTLYARARATGGKCRHCWTCIRRASRRCGPACATGPAPAPTRRMTGREGCPSPSSTALWRSYRSGR